MKKKKNSNLINFLLYFFSIMSITIFLLLLLTLKNECIKKDSEISNLNREKIYNINIVKELQSQKEYLLSENHITNTLSTRMIAVVPETLIVKVHPEQ